MTAKLSATARAWFAAQGKIGGAKAVGIKKLRGDRAYYAELGRKAAAARKLNRLQSECEHLDFADTLAGRTCLTCGLESLTPEPKGH